MAILKKIQKPLKVEGLTWTEGSEREDIMVDHKDGKPPKVVEKSPKVRGPFEKGNCRFVFLIQKRAYFVQKKAFVKSDDLKKFEKPPKV